MSALPYETGEVIGMDEDHSYRRIEMTVLMTPDMANFAGRVHGGSILKLLDQVAYACAARYSGSYVVTVSVDQVVFHEPLYVRTQRCDLSQERGQHVLDRPARAERLRSIATGVEGE
jgi:hypothetical protein